MPYDRPIVLSIAGFDPCGGAGILADVKTFEQTHCLGMAVVSALTIQTEDRFYSVNWMSSNEIIEQLKPLLERYKIEFVKIGIIKDIQTLKEVVLYIHSLNNNIKIIWDTVLSASSGFNLIDEINEAELKELLSRIYLITPNANEITKLLHSGETNESAIKLSTYCNVLLKGGHNNINKGTDILYENNSKYSLKPGEGRYYEKHGSGCILSAAITSELAKGKELKKACASAKLYIEKTLSSNKNLLGYHAQ